jgi:hypothetical protein
MNYSAILSLALITLSGTAFSLGLPAAQTSPQQLIGARLSTQTSTIREGDPLRARIEIENVSDHIILVGRDPELISNWPFRMEINLEDSSGKPIDRYGGSYLDPPPMADLISQDGVLKWWMPLAPHTFMGKYFILLLGDNPPGKYRLSFTYVSIRPHSPNEAAPEQRLIAAKFSIFEGTVQTNSIWIEILPKD